MNNDKLSKRLDHMMQYETDNFFVNINLRNDVADKLFDYQLLHVFNLVSCFRNNNIVIDSSSTGTGKTFTSIALCKQLNIRPFIICPITVIPTWHHVCNLFGIIPLGIVNYECIKTGKYYDKFGDRVDCKFLQVNTVNNNVTTEFKWNLPGYSVVIFDEVHKCRNTRSKNAKLLLSLKNNYQKILMLSATIADKPETFHIFGYMLGCYKKLSQAKNWINGMIQEDKTYIGSKPKLSAINNFLFPAKGSRMRIDELGSKFPKNQISVDNYFVEKDQIDTVNKAFETINKMQIQLKAIHLKTPDIQDTKLTSHVFAEISKARQTIERIKIPIFENLINDYIENGYNVVVFVNFTESIDKLCQTFKTDCVISGSQTLKERENNINKFQKNETNLIICNIAMAEGYSLHDLHGVPRVSLISPSFSSTHLVQSLGRINRAGSVSPAIQRIICMAGTLEDVICNNLKNKFEFLAKINDNDLININDNDLEVYKINI